MNRDKFTEMAVLSINKKITNLNDIKSEIMSNRLSPHYMKLRQVMEQIEICSHKEGVKSIEDIRTCINDAFFWYKPREFASLMNDIGFSRDRVTVSKGLQEYRWNMRLSITID